MCTTFHPMLAVCHNVLLCSECLQLFQYNSHFLAMLNCEVNLVFSLLCLTIMHSPLLRSLSHGVSPCLPYLSARPFVASQSSSLSLHVSHTVSPCLTPSHRVPHFPTVSHTVSPCPTLSHTVSPCLTLSHRASCRLTVPHTDSPCLTPSRIVSPYLTPSHRASH